MEDFKIIILRVEKCRVKRDTGLKCGLGGINVTEYEEEEGKVEKRERRRRSKVIRWSGEAWVYGVVLAGRRASEDLRLEEGQELDLLKGRPREGCAYLILGR